MGSGLSFIEDREWHTRSKTLATSTYCRSTSWTEAVSCSIPFSTAKSLERAHTKRVCIDMTLYSYFHFTFCLFSVAQRNGWMWLRKRWTRKAKSSNYVNYKTTFAALSHWCYRSSTTSPEGFPHRSICFQIRYLHSGPFLTLSVQQRAFSKNHPAIGW